MLGRAWPVRSPQSGGLSVRELRSGTDSAQSQVPHSAVAALRWLRLCWGARAVGPRRPAWGAVHTELPAHRGPRSSRCRLAACGVTQTSQRVPPQPPRALGSRPRRLPEPGACSPLSVPPPPSRRPHSPAARVRAAGAAAGQRGAAVTALRDRGAQGPACPPALGSPPEPRLRSLRSLTP